jgi:hypothetical protein
MINYNYTCRAGTVQGTGQVGIRQTCSAMTVRRPTSKRSSRTTFCSSSRGSYEKGRPHTSPITLGWQPSIEEGRGDPPKTARTYLPLEGPSIMSPHNDRCTSKGTVSPDQDQPDTAIATFSSSRPAVHSSTRSIRRARIAHHRTQPSRIICSREEQNRTLTDGVKGIRRNSRPCNTASSWQSWGRRRYGPVQ